MFLNKLSDNKSQLLSEISFLEKYKHRMTIPSLENFVFVLPIKTLNKNIKNLYLFFIIINSEQNATTNNNFLIQNLLTLKIHNCVLNSQKDFHHGSRPVRLAYIQYLLFPRWQKFCRSLCFLHQEQKWKIRKKNL